MYGVRMRMMSAEWHIAIYLLCALMCAGISWGSLWFDIAVTQITYVVWSYMNPIVVLEALALLLFFSKLSFSSRIVNTFAAGSFGVFLLHLHPVVYPIYTNLAVRIWERYDGNLLAYSVVIIGYMTAVYLMAWIIDLVRQLCWRLIAKHLPLETKNIQ